MQLTCQLAKPRCLDLLTRLRDHIVARSLGKPRFPVGAATRDHVAGELLLRAGVTMYISLKLPPRVNSPGTGPA